MGFVKSFQEITGNARKTSDFYDAEVDVAVDAVMGMMEPMIMVVLCVVVGFMVIAMFMPIFSMGSMVG